jgi:hypothetical protein
MIKLAFKGLDKILLIDGATTRTLGGRLRKKKGFDPVGAEDPFDNVFYYSRTENAQRFNGGDVGNSLMLSHFAHGPFSSAPGCHLNECGIAHVGDKLYTCHSVNTVIANETPGGSTLFFKKRSATNWKLVEWEGFEDNVDFSVYPSSIGPRVLWGYSPAENQRFVRIFGQITQGADVGLISYRGCVLGLGVAFEHNKLADASVSQTDEPTKVVGASLSSDFGGGPHGQYYSFLYDPNNGPQLASSGVGTTTFNLFGSGWINDPQDHESRALFTHPSWSMYYETEHDIDEVHFLADAPRYSYGINDMEEYHGRVYATNGYHLVSFVPTFTASGAFQEKDDFRIHYNTGSSAQTVTPKWLTKFNDSLYMFEADGTVSQISPATDGSATVTQVASVAYVDESNIRKGGMHAREWGIERATKNAFFTYQDKVHAIFGVSSGTYHMVSSGSLSSWTNITSNLPDFTKRKECNAHVIEDPHDNNLYVLFTTMTKHGAVGYLTFSDDSASIGYLYKYDGSTWTGVGWFPLQTMCGAGGLVGYDYEGPHVAFPSGAANQYPYDGQPTASGSTLTPVLYKCKDFAVLDYQLFDKQSRKVDVTIEYSLNDGYSWDTCRRFKDYGTHAYLGEATTGLTSSPSGEWHNFYWDFVNAVGYNVNYPYTRLRVVPSISATQT